MPPAVMAPAEAGGSRRASAAAAARMRVVVVGDGRAEAGAEVAALGVDCDV